MARFLPSLRVRAAVSASRKGQPALAARRAENARLNRFYAEKAARREAMAAGLPLEAGERMVEALHAGMSRILEELAADGELD